MTDRGLISIAAETLPKAYSPYSRIKVGAAIECTDGSIFRGCNIENAAFGASICAEAAALSAAITAGQRSFKRLAIISDSNSYCFPCGACRQLLVEFAPELEVLSAKADGRYVSYTMSYLLPMAFGKDQMSNL